MKAKKVVRCREVVSSRIKELTKEVYKLHCEPCSPGEVEVANIGQPAQLILIHNMAVVVGYRRSEQDEAAVS